MGCIFIFEKTMLIERRPVFEGKTPAVLPAVVAHDGSCRSTRNAWRSGWPAWPAEAR